MRMHGLLTAACAVLLSACAGNGEGLDENGRPSEEQPGDVLVPTFDSIQANVLTPACTGCHSGAGAPLGLRLDEGASFALLVNAPSSEVPTLLRVSPGNPDDSYLIHKLEGTAAVGGRMPLGGPPLPAETIAVVRQWIAEGAQPSAATLSSTKPSSIVAAWPTQGAELDAAAAVVIASPAPLDASMLEAGVLTLRRSGGDGDFANGNEVDLAPDLGVRSLSPTVIELQASNLPWVADEYLLRVSADAPLALTDLAAQPIDGDGDGLSGGDFVLNFSIRETAR